VDLSQYKEPHLIAGLLKVYFRDMETAMFTADLLKAWQDAKGLFTNELPSPCIAKF
jgi:hypothetical protein